MIVPWHDSMKEGRHGNVPFRAFLTLSRVLPDPSPATGPARYVAAPPRVQPLENNLFDELADGIEQLRFCKRYPYGYEYLPAKPRGNLRR